MAPMLDPRDKISSFRERHPRVASVLYQIDLCVMTFFLAITIGRYGPESEVLGRGERRCPNGAREDWLQLGFLEAIMPHFMVCPSTTTFIAAIILFLTGIIMLNYHNRDDAILPVCMTSTYVAIICQIEWKRSFTSLQERASLLIWLGSVMSALFHPIFRWAFPDLNAMLVRSKLGIDWISWIILIPICYIGGAIYSWLSPFNTL